MPPHLAALFEEKWVGHMTAELSEISEKLKALIADHDSQIRLVVQTGYDETGMVATTNGYLRLAQVLIEFVLSAKAQETETWDIYGHSLPGSVAINSLFRENWDVCIDTTMLAKTQEEVGQIAQAYWDRSPVQDAPAPRSAILDEGEEGHGKHDGAGTDR